MKAKKIAGGIAVALPIVMLSSFANAADQYTMSLVAGHIEAHAGALTCKTYEEHDVAGNYTGTKIVWQGVDLTTEYNAPIWQYKGQVGEMGCVVHASLAKQLFVPRDAYDPNTMPPYKGAKTAKGNNVATGAANDLLDGKYDSAVQHLCTFINVIDNSARLNSVDDFTPTTAEQLALDQIAAAEGWLDDLGELRTCDEILGIY